MSDQPPTADLRAILGDRYEAVMRKACRCDGTRIPHCFECGDSTYDHECPDPVPCEHRQAARTLAAVLPELLADAWDAGSRAGWSDRTRSFVNGARGLPDPADTPNPYRTETT